MSIRSAVLVSEIMTPGVVSLPEHVSLAEVCRALVRHHVHAVLIVDRAGAARGFVTARGLLDRRASDLDIVPASRAVDEPVVEIDPSASPDEAAELLIERDVSHLLVVRGLGHPPEGVVTALDVLRGSCA